ncbi:peptide methionine sulfoxide reductase MsrA [Lewinella aquimaris]|uniref:peptide-methionine (S)-S-oxide reductase n=1 Tax=Neolewinella aquimaris TaxID=1835722 RepID=A0A840E1I3_9BACT|nr:peptide methionine sulfoxide reductase MsrA [Neolewinella aquimaris]
MQVCEENTGHAEVVSVNYDTRILTTRDLLTEFFTLHNFELNRGRGTGQYRSAVFSLVEDEQLTTARQMLLILERAGYQPTTDVAVVADFHPADARHQQYCTARGMSPTRRNDTKIRELLGTATKPGTGC